MSRTSSLSVLLLPLLTAPVLAAEPVTGTVSVDCNGDAKCGIPERFRVHTHTFEYKLTLRHELRQSGVKVYDLTFPSPVKTDIPENNTVHAELFMPAGEGPFPACIVLDILQGNALIARSQAMWLAQHGVAGMVVYMAHYGPRRPPGSPTRLVSTDIPKTISGVYQTVQDIRCAVAWLANRPGIRPGKAGPGGHQPGKSGRRGCRRQRTPHQERLPDAGRRRPGGCLLQPPAGETVPLRGGTVRRQGGDEGAHQPRSTR